MDGIKLALSGSGTGAMAFHMGVLKRLAEEQKLEQVTALSSVSGGSLLTGMILHEAGMRWPGSAEYPSIHETLRGKLTSRSIPADMLRQLLHPRYLPLLPYRANLLDKALKNDWGIAEKLGSLPDSPTFSFGSAAAENGRPFFFRKDRLGDDDSGCADSGDVPMSCAMAASAAFPGRLGPFVFHTELYQWKKSLNKNSPGKLSPVSPKYTRLRLYDGAICDNLGLNFLGYGAATPQDGNGIIVSDAGTPRQQNFSHGALRPLRLGRAMDIMNEQARALRVRCFQDYLEKSGGLGGYLWIGARLKNRDFDNMRDYAVRFPATLRRLRGAEFDTIAAYGYEVAKECLPCRACEG